MLFYPKSWTISCAYTRVFFSTLGVGFFLVLTGASSCSPPVPSLACMRAFFFSTFLLCLLGDRCAEEHVLIMNTSCFFHKQ